MNSDSALWRADPQRQQNSQMQAFIDYAAQADYPALYQWSITEPEQFWATLWDFCAIVGEPGHKVVSQGEDFIHSRWFPEATLNFAENLLYPPQLKDPQQPALIARLENGQRQELSYQQLRGQVAAIAATLREAGVVPGDRVAGLLPNTAEAIIAMLATAAIGAIWTSCSPDFGVNGIVDRFGQTRPKVLFACNGYYYAGKTIDLAETLQQLSQSLPSLQQLVLVPILETQADSCFTTTASVSVQHWQQCLQQHRDAPLQFPALPFNQPLFILYSSGTTGVPKCIVHGAGGTLIQHLKEHRLHCDLKPGDRFFYFTTCGWMMWNWLATGLASAATLVLYDGSPFHPAPTSLIEMIDEEQIRIFGTSAKYLSALEKHAIAPSQLVSLDSLDTVLSTGSPLAEHSYHYVYQQWKKELCLASISGGTDIVACFALGNPLLPVYAGELQGPGLAMAVDVVDEAGQSVRQQKGELVCRQTFPSKPLSFWQDENNQRFREAYFSRFDNCWAHGDFAEITAHDGLIIHGRSDAVLNPGGVRIGTAEIYRQVETLTEITDALCIGQHWHNDVRIVLFVVLQPGLTLSAELKNTIKTTLRTQATPRHVPAKIIQVTELPRTRSGKLVEVAVRQIVAGESIGNTEAIANPEVLEQFKNIPELQQP